MKKENKRFTSEITFCPSSEEKLNCIFKALDGQPWELSRLGSENLKISGLRSQDEINSLVCKMKEIDPYGRVIDPNQLW